MGPLYDNVKRIYHGSALLDSDKRIYHGSALRGSGKSICHGSDFTTVAKVYAMGPILRQWQKDIPWVHFTTVSKG